MGDYADWAVEDAIFGSPFGNFESGYSPPTKAEILQKLSSFVGMAKDDSLKILIGNFAKEKGFDESLCKSKNVGRAKYNFVWNRRKMFNLYVQSIRPAKTNIAR